MVGNTSTVRQTAKIIRLTGSKSKIAYRPLPQDDRRKRRPDITKARELLNWKPQVELEEGLEKTLEKTIEYFKRQQ